MENFILFDWDPQRKVFEHVDYVVWWGEGEGDVFFRRFGITLGVETILYPQIHNITMIFWKKQ